MIESSFEFTVSAKNKPILSASGHKIYFKKKHNLPKTGLAQNIKYINVEQLPLQKKKRVNRDAWRP